MKKMTHMKKVCYLGDQDAFTITELLIGIAIIGIVAAIAVPTYMTLLSSTRLKKAGWSLVTDIETAKISAVGDNSQWAVQFDPQMAMYKVLSEKGSDNRWNTGDDAVFRSVKFSDAGISFGSGHGKRTGATSNQFDGVTFGNNRVIFNPDGTSVMGTVYIKNEKGYTIAIGSVSFDGQIKIWENNGSGWSQLR